KSGCKLSDLRTTPRMCAHCEVAPPELLDGLPESGQRLKCARGKVPGTCEPDGKCNDGGREHLPAQALCVLTVLLALRDHGILVHFQDSVGVGFHGSEAGLELVQIAVLDLRAARPASLAASAPISASTIAKGATASMRCARTVTRRDPVRVLPRCEDRSSRPGGPCVPRNPCQTGVATTLCGCGRPECGRRRGSAQSRATSPPDRAPGDGRSARQALLPFRCSRAGC